MLALLAIITGSVITGLSAYKIRAIRRGRDRKLRGMEVLRRLDIPPKKQARVWSVLLVLGLVLLTPGLGYLLAVSPIAGSEDDAPYSNLMTVSSGTPATAPLSEKLDKTPRTIEKDGSSTSSFLFSSGGSGSRKSSSGGGGGSSTTKKNTSVIETSQEGHVDDAGGHESISYVYETNATPEITVTESDPKKTDEPYETIATGAESKDGDDETEPTTLEDRTTSSAKTEPVQTEASIETAIIGVSPEKSTVPAFFEYSTEEVVSEDMAQKEIVSEDARNESNLEKAPMSSVVVEAASEKRAVPYTTPKYPMDETGPKLASEETSSGPEEAEVDLDESQSPDVTISSDESGPTLSTPTGLLGSEHESETTEIDDEPEASEDDGNLDLPWPTSITEDSTNRSFDLPQETEPKTTEVKKLLFGDSSTPETNESTNLSAEKAGEVDGTVPNMDDLFGGLNSTSGSYVLEEDPDFMSRFQDFTMNGQTGMGTEMNSTLKSAPLLEFDTIDFKSDFRSEAGLTPTSPFA